ncbi:DUF2333 family protein [Methylophaga muralis]|uniref:DUF2333 domain-containing protein n=1 Tax=Methylophaga muralis TaxID=291169 RepID=A0A1E3GR71_9GAMM|nr:DUF2333 family protein [Methylophaga muralis]ODN66543.1 hypothetical protein A9E74_01712 [Methylophaga muralis]
MAANSFFQRSRQVWWNFTDSFRDADSRRQISKALLLAVAIIVLLFIVIMIWWSAPPSAFDPKNNARDMAAERQHELVTGYTSTATLITLANTLLDKPGGYLTNDVMPPSVWMDNMPNWEFGVLVQIRDYSRALRNDISRSQSQSAEDKDLIIAEPQFNFNSDSWLFPSTESEYRDGVKALERYLARLADVESEEAQFYARADNLAAWLGIAEKRLGSLSQRLGASVGQIRVNTDLAGDPTAHQSTITQLERVTKTPWTKIDDVFYESRGSIWAMIHLLKAAEHDFADVLQKKNALISLRQIIRELEATQATVWSPIILNGSGFGLFANHSLVMASYVSRANAAMIDLRRLLEQG